MSTLEWVLLAIAGAAVLALLLAVAIYFLYRRFRVHPVLRRIQDLPWRGRLDLAQRLITDAEIPIVTRGILVVLTLYLVMPIDLIPDFIPIIGWLDDVMILGGGLLLFARLVPRERLDGHIAAVEGRSVEVVDVDHREAERSKQLTQGQ